MKKTTVLLIISFLLNYTLWSATFRYVNTTNGEKTYIDRLYENSTIEMGSEYPESLRILDENCLMDRPLYSFIIDTGKWEEYFQIRGSDKIVILCKSINDGVTEIKVSDKDNSTYRFLPVNDEKLTVSGIPPLLINLVEFANVKKNGTIINDYGTVIGNGKLDRLSVRMECQTTMPNEDIILNIKIIEKNGNLLRDRNSPKGYTFNFPIKTADQSGISTMQYFGSWNAKPLSKGCRMEIYANGRKLSSLVIPVKGVIMYRPLLCMKVMDNPLDITPVFSPQGRIAHRQLRSSIFYQVGNQTYKMLEWEEVER